MKISLYIASSLDGYIARTGGGIDWLTPMNNETEDYGYKKFYESIDAVAMGRKTYDSIKEKDLSEYDGKDLFVFTNRELSSKKGNVYFVKIDPKEFVRNLTNRGLKHLWVVGGGELIRLFLNENLVDEYIISIVPILLGEGVPLFHAPFNEQSIQYVSSKDYKNGVVQLVYHKKVEDK
ncbi:MAG: dihydrofolate reductase family protein [Ignavibacteriaceae bacterium]|nr:dihydrofolate reductase family protein [Ignavibacteriaceae bacterium]